MLCRRVSPVSSGPIPCLFDLLVNRASLLHLPHPLTTSAEHDIPRARRVTGPPQHLSVRHAALVQPSVTTTTAAGPTDSIPREKKWKAKAREVAKCSIVTSSEYLPSTYGVPTEYPT